jgi:uncharacterized membrane protein (DUF485 family)
VKSQNRFNKNEQKPLSPKTKRLAISLVINSLLLLFIYYGAMGLNIPIVSFVVTFGYMLVFGGFLIAYIAYNRAFSRKGMTPDMLPDSWSNEKKQEYIEDGVRRQEKSKWMLSVIIPFLITLMADALYLFVWDGFLKNMLDGILLTVAFTVIGA